MREAAFRRQRADDWERLRQLLANGQPDAALPKLQRQVCHDLALARTRGYSMPLQEELERLAIAGHSQFHSHTTSAILPRLRRLLLMDFPRGVRAEWQVTVVALLCLVLPLVGCYTMTVLHPAMAWMILPAENLQQMVDIHDPAHGVMATPRSLGQDVHMWGQYIQNNVGIGFKCFASGILAGLGSVFYLTFNGVVLGTIAGHMHNAGNDSTFWPFVSTHGAPELTGIVLAGAAGLRLGMGVVRPGNLPWLQSVRAAALRGLPLLGGAVAMITLAAFIEAFWSARASVSANTKMFGGMVAWLTVLGFLLCAGRGADET